MLKTTSFELGAKLVHCRELLIHAVVKFIEDKETSISLFRLCVRGGVNVNSNTKTTAYLCTATRE